MPIDENFPEGFKTIGKISHSYGENFHLVWGPGKENGGAYIGYGKKDF